MSPMPETMVRACRRVRHTWAFCDNINDPKILALGTRVLQADINSQVAKDAGIALPYTGFTGNVAQALRLFPQYQTIAYRALAHRLE